MDETLKTYFQARTPLPPKLREQTFALCREAALQKQTETAAPSNWVWGVIAFDFVISFAILYVLWFWLGQGILMYVITAFFIMSLVSAVVVTGVRNVLVS